MALDLEEKAGGRVGRIEANGRSVLLAEGGSDGFEADPEAGALVAEDGTPAARTVEAAVGRAADDVGAGAGDDEDSWASGEGCVEGDFFVAAEDERAGDFGGDCGGGPGADGRDGEAGEAEAGASDLAERDAGGGDDLFDHGLEASGGFCLRDAHEFDGAGGGTGEDAGRVGEEALRFGAAGIDGEEEGHGGNGTRFEARGSRWGSRFEGMEEA